ncbi:MAG: hypothetical protein ACFB4I_24010 [Cyanophyceae cyanobacterium]
MLTSLLLAGFDVVIAGFFVFCLQNSVRQHQFAYSRDSQISETRESGRRSRRFWVTSRNICIALLSARIVVFSAAQSWFLYLFRLQTGALITPLFQTLKEKRWIDASGISLLLVACVSLLYLWFGAENGIIGGVIAVLAAIGLWIICYWHLTTSFLRK